MVRFVSAWTGFLRLVATLRSCSLISGFAEYPHGDFAVMRSIAGDSKAATPAMDLVGTSNINTIDATYPCAGSTL